jgi:hypothetical protein
LKSVALPDKVYGVTLEEADLAAGQLREAACCECAEQLGSFDSLKAHFAARHLERWAPRPGPTIRRTPPTKKDFLTGGCDQGSRCYNQDFLNFVQKW